MLKGNNIVLRECPGNRRNYEIKIKHQKNTVKEAKKPCMNCYQGNYIFFSTIKYRGICFVLLEKETFNKNHL